MCKIRHSVLKYIYSNSEFWLDNYSEEDRTAGLAENGWYYLSHNTYCWYILKNHMITESDLWTANYVKYFYM